MKYIIAMILISSTIAKADTLSDMQVVALKAGFKPSMAVLEAIKEASEVYKVDALEMLAISLIETGGGQNMKVRMNHNKTQDTGLFQINTINKEFCEEFNLNNIKGNSMCAAKLLRRIKTAHKTDKEAVARFHSNTKIHKDLYFGKIQMLLAGQ